MGQRSSSHKTMAAGNNAANHRNRSGPVSASNTTAIPEQFAFGATDFSTAPATTVLVRHAPEYSPTMRLVKPLPRSKRSRPGSDEFPSLPVPAPSSYYYPIAEIHLQYQQLYQQQQQAQQQQQPQQDDTGGGNDRDQQGNTKKRKVPGAAQHFRTASSSSDGETDAAAGAEPRYVGTASTTPAAKPRLSAITLAGLKMKDALVARKRLLASILGPSVASGDTIALDLALSAPLNWHLQGFPQTQKKRYFARSSAVKRRKLRSKTSTSASARCALPSGEFTFSSPSSSGERMKTVMAEMTAYRERFNAELAVLVAKQAEKAKKAAAAASAAGTSLPDGTSKRNGRKSKSGNALHTPPTGLADQSMESLDPNDKKKKRRSRRTADPHQIKNYIPSRQVSATAGAPQPPTAAQAALNLKNFVSPHPISFLSAEPPRRTRDRVPVAASSLPPVQPMDEWICSFCEFKLFYGDESACRRAIRARKKLLNRRRRARERAAAAASGQGKLLSTGKKGYGSGEEDGAEGDQEAKFADPAEVDARVAATVSANAHQGKPVMRDKDKDGGGGLDVVGSGSRLAGKA